MHVKSQLFELELEESSIFVEKLNIDKKANGLGKLEKDRLCDRSEVTATVEIKQANTKNFKAQISDLSVSGFKLVCFASLLPTKSVFIRIPGLSLITADIKWSNGTEYGCAFRNLLHPAVLDNLVYQLRKLSEGNG